MGRVAHLGSPRSVWSWTSSSALPASLWEMQSPRPRPRPPESGSTFYLRQFPGLFYAHCCWRSAEVSGSCSTRTAAASVSGVTGAAGDAMGSVF